MNSLLVGETIVGIYVSKCQHNLYFQTARQPNVIQWETQADCCSETWFADIYNVKAILNTPILEVSSIRLPEELTEQDIRHRQDPYCDQFYGHNIKTAKGTATIVYRNSSNGYYGGWHQELKSELSLIPPLEKITAIHQQEDWSA